jgi:hypothetical protein
VFFVVEAHRRNRETFSRGFAQMNADKAIFFKNQKIFALICAYLRQEALAFPNYGDFGDLGDSLTRVDQCYLC